MWFNDADTTDAWYEAIAHLRGDRVLAGVIDAVGPCTLRPRRDYFVVLCKAIFSQQISTTVAATLFGRFSNLFPQRRPTPSRVIEVLTAPDPTRLLGCGLSRQKHSYLLDLARAFEDGRIRTARFASASDEEIIEHLIQVKGIGRWTGEMFLIFVLNRPDLLPVDDLGLRKGVMRAYRLRTLPDAKKLKRVAERWKPYRSIATWYLWRLPAETPKPVE